MSAFNTRSTGAAADLPAAAVTGPAATPSLLDWVLRATTLRSEAGTRVSPLLRWLAGEWSGRSLAEVLWALFGDAAAGPRGRILSTLQACVAEIDARLAAQVDAVLHHPDFQQLEAAWRGVDYLVRERDKSQAENIQIRVLDISWEELYKDLDGAMEFDQSQIFKHVYSAEFDMPGGTPYGVLIGNYALRPHPRDFQVLDQMSGVAASCFCPFITGVSPEFLGVTEFSELESVRNLAAWFDQPQFVKWRAFRASEDARYVGLALPRVLMRLPYEDDGAQYFGFRYRESVSGPGRESYLWGNAAFAFGEVLLRAFGESCWLANIRGVHRNLETGGLVTGLPAHSFATDRQGIAVKPSTDFVITDNLEKQLSELGFLPLCHCHDTPWSAFYSNESAQLAKRYNDPGASRNARISKMLQYMFCSSRFAHYLKVLARDKAGSFQEPGELQQFLQHWVSGYVTPDADARRDVKARFPLREAQVEVRANPGDPGHFLTSFRLWPHFELDELQASLRLQTELPRL